MKSDDEIVCKAMEDKDSDYYTVVKLCNQREQERVEMLLKFIIGMDDTHISGLAVKYIMEEKEKIWGMK